VNPVTVLVGVAAVVYGVYTAWARRAKPEQFKKLDAMTRMWGHRGGLALHVVGYTVVPIVIGMMLILGGLRGTSLF
jgi:hypothetical protein